MARYARLPCSSQSNDVRGCFYRIATDLSWRLRFVLSTFLALNSWKLRVRYRGKPDAGNRGSRRTRTVG